jgi:hypothetical protein
VVEITAGRSVGRCAFRVGELGRGTIRCPSSGAGDDALAMRRAKQHAAPAERHDGENVADRIAGAVELAQRRDVPCQADNLIPPATTSPTGVTSQCSP